MGGLISSSTRKSPVYYANSLLAGRLDRYIKEHSFDLILTPHLYAAEVLTCLKHRGLLSVPVIAIGTDYTCIPFWEETDCDCYIVPQKDLLGELIHKGLPKKQLFPLGIPVKQAFSTQKKRSLARKLCRLPSDAHVYLVMSGSMGFGKVNLLVAELIRKLEADEYVVVICGNNRRLRQIMFLPIWMQVMSSFPNPADLQALKRLSDRSLLCIPVPSLAVRQRTLPFSHPMECLSLHGLSMGRLHWAAD